MTVELHMCRGVASERIRCAYRLTCMIRAELSLRRRRNGLPYPPGPRRLPVIGNTFQLPTSYEWLQAAEWKKYYGDIVYVEALGQPLLFVNSYDIAVELLDKRSVIYSSRMESYMTCAMPFCFLLLLELIVHNLGRVLAGPFPLFHIPSAGEN